MAEADLGTCDLCLKPARWCCVVKGCSDHKEKLKAAIDGFEDPEAVPSFEHLWALLSKNQPDVSGIIDAITADSVKIGAALMYKMLTTKEWKS